ncbi:MAG: hypothetical protein ABW213_04890 [Tardiphaga sp.]
MPTFRHRLPALLGLMLLSCSLGGCGSVSSFLAGGMADLIPAWAGGLPADAPPRPGTAEYDAYVKQREAQKQLPSQGQPGADPAMSPSAKAVQ